MAWPGGSTAQPPALQHQGRGTGVSVGTDPHQPFAPLPLPQASPRLLYHPVTPNTKMHPPPPSPRDSPACPWLGWTPSPPSCTQGVGDAHPPETVGTSCTLNMEKGRPSGSPLMPPPEQPPPSPVQPRQPSLLPKGLQSFPYPSYCPLVPPTPPYLYSAGPAAGRC